MFEKLRLFVATQLLLFALCHSAVGANIGFSSAKNYPLDSSPFDTISGVVMGDFNGDGKVDLAVANSGYAPLGHDGNVAILLGNGDGTFQAAKNFPAGKNPSFIAVGDFDGDRKLDLLVVNPSDSTTGVIGGVSLLLANADGTFKQPVNILTGHNPGSLVVGDFDGDHKLDVAIAGSDASGTDVIVLLGNGNGTFRPPVTYTVDGSPTIAGDINGDGKMDLIGTASIACGSEELCGKIIILLGNGDGSFQPQLDYTAPGEVSSISAGDFNGDNRLDLTITWRGNVFAIAETDVLLNNGDGTFSHRFVTYGGAGTGGDFDGDGKLDLVGGSNDGIGIFLGNGDGSFQPALTFVSPVGAGSVGDLNGDGLPDFVGANNADSIGVMLNTSRLSGADLSVNVINTTSALGDPPNPQLQVLVNNRGPHDATAVTLSNSLSGNFTSASVSSSLGTCQGVALLTCDFGTLSTGTLAIITIQTQTPPMPVTVTDTATVSGGGGDPDSSNNSATGTFTYELFTLTVADVGKGSGTVTSNLPITDINCGSSCSAKFINGFIVTLTATPAPGSTFAGWGGACTGTGFCLVTMNANENVTATFQLAPDFSISASALTNSTVSVGGSATSKLTVGAVNGFSSSVALTCSVSPSPLLAPQCSITPNSVDPGTPATLTVTTTAPRMALASPSWRSSWFYAMWLPMIGLGLISIGSRGGQKRWPFAFLFCSLLFAGTLFQGGCGGGGNDNGSHGSGGTTAGNYTITIAGTSGPLQHSTSVMLTVQ
jgi:uncharacterized repeat protein (TIGR01451 family)